MSIELAELKAAVMIIDEAGKAIDSLTNGLKNAVTAGTALWDASKARLLKKHMIELITQLNNMHLQKLENINKLQQFLHDPSDQHWNEVKAQLSDINESMKVLLELLKGFKDPNLEKCFRDLKVAVASKSNFIIQLEAMNKPVDQDELTELGRMMELYSALGTSIENLLEPVSDYTHSIG